jgi:hypothetical protein
MRSTNHEVVQCLGFVIDDSQPLAQQLTHALVNLKATPSDWYVIPLSDSAYPEAKGSVSRYFRHIFFTSVQIWNFYRKHGNLYKDVNFIPGPVTRDIAKYLHNVNRSNKLVADPMFPVIRRAVLKSLFGFANSGKPNCFVSWRGASTPKSIFFWSRETFAKSPFKDTPAFGKITIDHFEIISTVDPRELEELAILLLNIKGKLTWQDLYLQTLATIDIESWIDITLSCANETIDHNSASPKSAINILASKNSAILYGQSGTGKTTLLKQLSAHFGKQALSKAGAHVSIPVLISLASLESHKETTLVDTLCESICDVIKKLKMSQLQEWYQNQKEEENTRVSRKMLLSRLKDDIAIALEGTIKMSDLVLLIDGINDTTPIAETTFISELKEAMKECPVVIAATRDLEVSQKLFNFGDICLLSPLTDKYIIQCIKAKKPDWPSSKISFLPDTHPKLFNLLKRPFYLKVFCESCDKPDFEHLPTSSAKLISQFMISTKDRNIRAKETITDGIGELELNNYISIMAHKVLTNLTKGKSQRLYYPADFIELDRNCGWQHIIHIGAVLGVFTVIEEAFGKSPFRRRIVFDHDLFRDYFAAMWLDQNGFSDWEQDQLDNILEHKIWDTPILMYFELQSQDASRYNDILLRISHRDPYLAASCVDSMTKVSLDIIWPIFLQLKRAEGDFLSTEEKLFSNEGVNAAKILLSKLPLEIVYSLVDGLTYSLEFFAIPHTLLKDKRINSAALAKIIASLYGDYPTILFDILAGQNDVPAFEFIIIAIDMVLSDKKLPDAIAFRLIQIILGTKYDPKYEDVLKLQQLVRNPLVKYALYFKARHLPQLEEIARDAHDDIIMLIYVFNVAEQTSHDFSKFAELLPKVLSDHFENQVFFNLMVYVATLYPHYIEQALIHQLEKELEGVPNHALVARIIYFLVMCGTESAAEAVTRLLCTGDAYLLTKLLFYGQTDLIATEFAREFRKIITDQLTSGCYAQTERSSFVRFALHEQRSEIEYNNLIQQLDTEYKNLKSKKVLSYDKEFEFRTMCILSWRSMDSVELWPDWDDYIIHTIAPDAMRHRLISRCHKKLRHFFQQDNEESIEMGIDSFLESGFMESEIDDQTRIFKAAIPDGKIDFVMRVMRNRIHREMTTMPDQKTRILQYWYRSLQKIVADESERRSR